MSMTEWAKRREATLERMKAESDTKAVTLEAERDAARSEHTRLVTELTNLRAERNALTYAISDMLSVLQKPKLTLRKRLKAAVDIGVTAKRYGRDIK